jgi:ribosomal protein S18 acetylase RimI-like enzyme
VADALDHPVWGALTGPDAAVAERRGDAVRYDPAISPFAAVAPGAGAGAWSDLAELLGADDAADGGTAVFAGSVAPPSNWRRRFAVAGFQMVRDAIDPAPDDPDVVVLGPDDAAAMLDLAGRTRPGPFLLRTRELGGYLGIRRAGRLVAMAGERLHPPGFTEISAVCTDEGFRGQGLAGRLVRAVAAGIAARGEIPFLHVAGSNAGARRLYESLGFHVHRPITFEGWTRAAKPGGAGG